MLYIVYRAERVYSKRWLVNYWLLIRVSKAFFIYAAISISTINTHYLKNIFNRYLVKIISLMTILQSYVCCIKVYISIKNTHH